MVRPNRLGTQAPLQLSFEEVTAHAERKVLMELDEKGALIFGNSWWILGQQFRPRPINLFNIIIIITHNNYTYIIMYNNFT